MQLHTRRQSNISNLLLLVTFSGSLYLIFLGIGIYRKTIIESQYLILTTLFGIVLATIFLLTSKKVTKSFWNFLIPFIMGGGIAYFLTLYSNSLLANKEIRSEIFIIRETGNLGRGGKSSCRSPYAVVDFYGLQKQLIFLCDYENTIHNFKKVKIGYVKGFWGFDVIRNQEPFN